MTDPALMASADSLGWRQERGRLYKQPVRHAQMIGITDGPEPVTLELLAQRFMADEIDVWDFLSEVDAL